MWYYQVHSFKKGANTEQSKRCVKKSSAEGSVAKPEFKVADDDYVLESPAYFPDVEILILLKSRRKYDNSPRLDLAATESSNSSGSSAGDKATLLLSVLSSQDIIDKGLHGNDTQLITWHTVYRRPLYRKVGRFKPTLYKLQNPLLKVQA